MILIICESLREIGEVACVTSAWSSRGQTLKFKDKSCRSKRHQKQSNYFEINRILTVFIYCPLNSFPRNFVVAEFKTRKIYLNNANKLDKQTAGIAVN